MALGFSTNLRNARADAITTFAGSSAVIRFYSGTRPSTGTTTPTALVSLTGTGVFASAAVSGVITLTGFTPAPASNADTATWFRISKADGTFVMDGSVGSDVTMTDPILSSGEVVGFSTMTITEGNA